MKEKNDRTIRIAIIHELATNYKEGFYKRLFNNSMLSVKIYCQDQIKSTNMVSIHDKYPDHIITVSYKSIFNNTLTWHFLPYNLIRRNFDVFVFGGNPRSVSQLLFAIYLKLLNKQVIIWNLAHSHRNSRLNEKIRLFLWKFFDNFLLYTPGCIEYLRKVGFNRKNMLSINNGLELDNITKAINHWNDARIMDWRTKNKITNRIIILSCGRLNRKNTHNGVIESFNEIVEKIPAILWCIIGDGKEKHYLENLVEDLHLEDNIIFLGGIYKQEKLAPWFLTAKLFIHPAPIGLSILHAFSYGLPIITHDFENEHGPEFNYFQNGINGLLYRYNDYNDLNEKITNVLMDSDLLSSLGANSTKTAKLYNTEIMACRFGEMLQKVLK